MADPGAQSVSLEGIEMWGIQAKRQAVKLREWVSWPQARTEHEKRRGLRLGSGEISGMSRARENLSRRLRVIGSERQEDI